jgi:hypothetical protein
MYNVFLFLDSWIVYDATNKVKKPLTPVQANLLKELFPLLFSERKILNAVKISNVNPNNLDILSDEKPAKEKGKNALETKIP